MGTKYTNTNIIKDINEKPIIPIIRFLPSSYKLPLNVSPLKSANTFDVIL